MIEYIISYAIKAGVLYFYWKWAIPNNTNVIPFIIQIVAIWWLLDNVITPLLNQEDRDQFFSRIFSVDVLNLCLSIYYIIAGVLMYMLFDKWYKLTDWYTKVLSLFVFMIAYNRVYFAIVNMNSKQISEGFCACAL